MVAKCRQPSLSIGCNIDYGFEAVFEVNGSSSEAIPKTTFGNEMVEMGNQYKEKIHKCRCGIGNNAGPTIRIYQYPSGRSFMIKPAESTTEM
jgi:hypothetical protein